jgi:hypothetical protein
LIGGWNIFYVSLGPKIFILKLIGGQIIFNSHWILKDEEAIGQGEQAQGKVIEAYQGKEECLVLWKRERKRMNM